MESIKRNRWYYYIQLLVDVVIINLSYYWGFYLQRPQLFVNGLSRGVFFSLISITIVSIPCILAFKLHKCGKKAFSVTMLFTVMMLPFVAFSAVFIDFIIKGIGIWRKTTFYALCIQLPLFAIIKYIFHKLHRYFIKPMRTLVVGRSATDAARLYLRMKAFKNPMFEIHDLASEFHPNLHHIMMSNQNVMICSSVRNKADLIEYCAAHRIDCAIIPSYHEVILNSGKFNNIGDILLCNMQIKLDVETRFVKRLMDIGISTLGLILMSPVMLLVAMGIKIQDKGNVIFSQKRVTWMNREFNLYKFRTMIPNAEKETGAVLASPNDVRITRFGKFLRASRLDELPQLWNVLKGEMSIVGPRPERPEVIKDTIEHIPEFSYRTVMKAGITGLAQTLGRYDTEFSDKLRFDLFYVNNYSLILDCKILFYTIQMLITSSSLYNTKLDPSQPVIEIVKSLGFQPDNDFELTLLRRE